MTDVIDQARTRARQEAEASHEVEIEQLRVENLMLAEEANNQLTAATEAAKNSTVGQYAAGKIEQTKRVIELQDQSTDQLLDWWQKAIDLSKIKQREFERRYR